MARHDLLRALERTLRRQHVDHLGDRVDAGALEEAGLQPGAAAERQRVDDASAGDDATVGINASTVGKSQRAARAKQRAAGRVAKRTVGIAHEAPAARRRNDVPPASRTRNAPSPRIAKSRSRPV